MSGRRALVTLAVGEEFERRWRRLCEANWRAYAERHGYELVCLTEPLDDCERARARSPSWQKLLVPSQPWAGEFERIVWVDSDLVFGEGAPDVAAGVPPERVGAVDEFDQPDPLRRSLYAERIGGYYAEVGLEREWGRVTQGGLFVLSPAHHREPFARAYEHEDIGSDYEMRFISHELLSADLVHWLDPRFNVIAELYKLRRYPELVPYPRHPRSREVVQRALSEVWGLHFAGQAELMEVLLGPPAPEPASAAAPGKRPAPEAPVRAPVVMLTFARPDTTARVLEAVRRARPSRLLMVANAPRAEVPGEAELCERTRELFEDLDWDCELETAFADEHLSQKRRIESGLDWAFGRVDEAIVLEDDCVPDPGFFGFCDALLERYRDDPRVLSISGDNTQLGERSGPGSYYFSRYPQIWGWAGWRRSWELYDPGMEAWPALRDGAWLREILGSERAVAYWQHLFDRTYGEGDAWDRAWLFAGWLSGGLHAIPAVNLVSNVGFRADATNTRPRLGSLLAELPAVPIGFPLEHPSAVERDREADERTERVLFSGVISQLFERVRAARRLERVEADA